MCPCGMWHVAHNCIFMCLCVSVTARKHAQGERMQVPEQPSTSDHREGELEETWWEVGMEAEGVGVSFCACSQE